MNDIQTLAWQGDTLKLIDQRALPTKEVYLTCHTCQDTVDAIKNMVVRGAPAIGLTAAYGVVLSAKEIIRSGQTINIENLTPYMETLAQSRPTAVNLFQALGEMRACLLDAPPDENPLGILEQKALTLHQTDKEACLQMAQNGIALLAPESLVYTHCNAGALATGGIGTALGIITTAHAQGLIQEVMVDETRPWFQGARLTSWELKRAGVPFKLAVEGAAGALMKQKKIDWVITGADRIAANGDAANKVGTYNLAVLAKYHGAKMMVAAPLSTIDWNLTSGDEIPIESRSPEEVTHFNGTAIAPENIQVENPVFDVTPAELIDVIVTEKGVVQNPSLTRMMPLRE